MRRVGVPVADGAERDRNARNGDLPWAIASSLAALAAVVEDAEAEVDRGTADGQARIVRKWGSSVEAVEGGRDVHVGGER